MRKNFENEIEIGKKLENEAVEKYEATCKSYKTIYDAQLKKIYWKQQSWPFQEDLQIFWLFWFCQQWNRQLQKFNWNQGGRVEIWLLEQIRKQTSVDYCGNEKFQFATATVLVEHKKKLKAEVRSFLTGLREEKHNELKSFKQEQESCTVQ